MPADAFLRTKFICIIWTFEPKEERVHGSWGLSLFVLFERSFRKSHRRKRSWGLSLFVLFEQVNENILTQAVLED